MENHCISIHKWPCLLSGSLVNDPSGFTFCSVARKMLFQAIVSYFREFSWIFVSLRKRVKVVAIECDGEWWCVVVDFRAQTEFDLPRISISFFFRFMFRIIVCSKIEIWKKNLLSQFWFISKIFYVYFFKVSEQKNLCKNTFSVKKKFDIFMFLKFFKSLNIWNHKKRQSLNNCLYTTYLWKCLLLFVFLKSQIVYSKQTG